MDHPDHHPLLRSGDPPIFFLQPTGDNEHLPLSALAPQDFWRSLENPDNNDNQFFKYQIHPWRNIIKRQKETEQESIITQEEDVTNEDEYITTKL